MPTELAIPADDDPPQTSDARNWSAIEVGLILLLFFIFAGWAPPDVNEAHYLSKAKHYWNPQWCAGDAFLESDDAHIVFYWTFGWLTLVMPLPLVAWVGRIVTWSLLAWSWQRLSRAVVPVPLASVLSAALFLTFIQHGHMAGEWVVGGVEAKGFAFALVFLAIEAMLRGRWNRVWLLLGAATSFHVLVGGWSFIAGGCAWLSCGKLRPSPRGMLPFVGLGLLLALPGLIPALALTSGVSPGVAREANHIYVYSRLSHHLVFHRFPHWYMARHALLLLIWIAASCTTPCPIDRGQLGQRPLRGFVGGAVALAVIGIIIDQSTLYHLDIAASLLRYYWYRMSDAMLPVGAALSLVSLIFQLRVTRPRISKWSLAAVLLLVSTNLAATNLIRRSNMMPGADLQTLAVGQPEKAQRAYRDWTDCCAWIRQFTDPDDLFLTPRMQQTFKWYAQRPEVCSWKDVPQDAASLVKWWRLQQEIYPRPVVHHGLSAHGEQRLIRLARKYHAHYLVVDQTRGGRRLSLPRVYPPSVPGGSALYEVYRIPSDPLEVTSKRAVDVADD